MDWITWLAVGFALLWIFCFIDGNAVLELRLFFHDLSQATSHLYLALLPLRRAASHFTKCVRHLVWHPQQSSSQYQDRPMANESMLHLLEGLCVVYETLPNLMGAALSVCTAFCHILQGGFYIMAATLRTVRNDLFFQVNGEKERWDKERLRAKEREKSEFQRAGVNVLSAPWSRTGQGGGHMDWWTSLAASIALLWIFCFIDGNAVLELRLLFHALTKAACHLYLALLPLRRAATHFADCARHLVNHAQQNPSPHGFLHQGQSLAKKGTLHFLEGVCVVCETVPNLMGAALSVGAAFCHMLQGGFYILAATLRTIQINLFSQMNGEKERWDKERLRAKESEKKMNSKVLEYISVFCQDPVSALRIKVDVPPVYR